MTWKLIRVLFIFYLYASNRLCLFLLFVFVFFSGVEETRRKTTLCQKKVTGKNEL